MTNAGVITMPMKFGRGNLDVGLSEVPFSVKPAHRKGRYSVIILGRFELHYEINRTMIDHFLD